MTLTGVERTLRGGHFVANFRGMIRAVVAKRDTQTIVVGEVGEPSASTFTHEVGNDIAENHGKFESFPTASVEVPLPIVNPQLHSF